MTLPSHGASIGAKAVGVGRQTPGSEPPRKGGGGRASLAGIKPAGGRAGRPIQTLMSLVIEENEVDSLLIRIEPEVVSGAPGFRGTRVSVDALRSNLEAGLTVDDFLENFPTVTREQALQVLGLSRSTLQRLAESK